MRLIFLFLFMSFLSITSFSQDVIFNSQADVNAFDPSITNISDDLIIETTNSSDPITDLSNLSNLISIGHDLKIMNNTDLTNIDGLSNLASISRYLHILNNNALTNINSLSNLTIVNGSLIIQYNNALTNIDGLSNVSSVGYGLPINNSLRISNNDALMNIDGLASLTAFANSLRIEDNAVLSNIDGLLNLTSTSYILEINNNDALANINGLANMTSIGYLPISNNPALTNIDGLSNLTYVGTLDINNNDALTNIDGLSNLITIGSSFDINNNAALTDINGLASLSSAANMNINNNAALTNIDGLPNLATISEYLNIEDNSSLTSIGGFANLTSIDQYLNISNNDDLININGFTNLPTVGENLIIGYNNDLSSINGFTSLTTVIENLAINNHGNLTSIDGLSNLNSIGGNVYLNGNALVNINGLSNLNSIGGYLKISWNALPNLDGLSNLTSINGYFDLKDNGSLTNIDGLSNLSYVGSLDIDDNDALTNIDGLANLTAVGGDLVISNNLALTNIDGLLNITSLGLYDYLEIEDNDALTNIDGLSNLISVGGDFTIRWNNTLANCCGIQNILNTPGAILGTITILNLCGDEENILNTFCGLDVNIFNDLNQDCVHDIDEVKISNRSFIIQPGDIVGEANIAGHWITDSLPPGTYTMTIDTTGNWISTCLATQSFTVTDVFAETILPTFGLVSTEPCPEPNVSIHMPFMRPCFDDQKIYIQACNRSNATGALENPYVVVTLDPLVIPNNSSIPYTILEDNVYQFDITTLNPGACVDFWINTMLSCDAVLGQGLCMEANLLPAADCVFDDIPNPYPPNVGTCNTNWDMSSLTVEGYCQNDSIFFEITNNGSGDMTCFSPVNIYINGNLIILDSVQLLSGEMAFFNFSADGQSWRLEAAQHPLHPGNSQPNAIIEGCGENTATLLSYVNAMPQDDADPVVDIYCGIVTGSYDPNDKTGFPLGVNESNDILPNQKIEYLIRFQNTGTDTAFTVVIRDTLSTDFDIFSVESGVASHAYEFTMYGSRVMEWTFNDILLVDSFTNEPGSHGFIKFTVEQNTNLPEGTILENNAGIYFDFNDPIITNTSSHTIDFFTPNMVTTNVSATACGSYTSPAGNLWTNTGTYYDIYETENGDSIVMVDLLVTEFDVNIQAEDDNTLIANIPNATYQWLDCNNNSLAISGATNQNFTPTETGDYAVQITQDNCTSISDCYNVILTGINNPEFASSFMIYPNPTKNKVFVNFNTVHKELKITLRNVLGQIIFIDNINNASEYHFNIEAAAGLYFLQVETTDKQSAIFKILKN